LAYVFDPTTNTLIDDEDKSLGNKLALLDSDLEAAIQSLNEKFGPGAVQQGTQGIPTPPKTIEREMFKNAFKDSLADGGRVNFQTGTEAASMAAEEFKTNVLPKYVKELERWIKKNAKKYNIKTLDKFYDDAVKHFNKPPYTGNPFGKNFVSEATIKPSRLKAGESINTFRLGDYAFKNLLSLSPTTTDSTSKVRYVKDMMMVELIEKDPKVKKIFVDYYNGKPLGIKELATMNRFNKEFLRGGTVDRPNLLRKYFQNLNPNFEKIRSDVAVFADSVTKQIAALRDNPNLSPAMRKKYKEAYTSVRRMSDTFRTRFIKEYPKTLNKNAIDFQGNKIAKELFQFEHKAPRVSADLANLPNSYLARTSMTPGTFNVLKMRDFDIPLDNLINEYQAADVKDRKKIKTKINKLYDTFNKNSGGYLNELKISFNEKLGKVNLKDTTPMLKSKNINYDAFEKQVAKNIIHADTYYKNVNKDKFRYDEKTIKKLSENILKVKKHANSKGFKLNSFAGVLDFSQAGLELPPAIKKASDDILKIGGQVLRAGGKAAVVLDPMFAAADASKAFKEGASGKQAVNYVAGRFFEGLVNLPALAKGGFDFAVDKARGKDAKFEMPYEATFAQDYLKNVLEQTPEEILEARKAQLEFDQTVRPGMTMVDDIDIPKSKTEIEAARERFMDEKGIDLSVLDEPKPDKTFSQFLANGGRVGFSNGGAAGANENFAAELEYFLTNEDAELPQLSTYSEPNNPIEIINDIIDPRNYPYYADVLARSGIRIGEFATRILPATGKLINDLITKPAFKIERPSEGVSKKSDYVQEYTDILPSNIKGTGIFSEYLKNITPTTTEKFIGLDKLIEKEEQKQKDRGSTVGPKVFADTIGLGTEVTAPIFPGLKVAQKVLKPKKIAAAVENRKTDAPEIPNKVPKLDSIENLELNLAILRNRAKNPDAPVEEVTRVLVTRLLDKKGIQYGNNDPVDVYMDIYGDIILDVKNLAEEIVDGIQAGRNFKSIDDLLRIEGLDDIPIPKEPNQGVPTEDVIEMLEKDLREKKMLEGFNTTDKTKNAKGGIIK
tara:strand:+ start:468 stop:3653 length:3186 start_codon:yes stop_codon:yes gene_type:complete